MADNDFAEFKRALIVGAGSGLSAALARTLTRAGLNVTLAARTIDDLAPLQHETGAQAVACDATKPAVAHAVRSSIWSRPRWKGRSQSVPSAASW